MNFRIKNSFYISFLLLAVFISFTNPGSANTDYTISEAAKWVEPIYTENASTVEEKRASSDKFFLLVDNQTKIDKTTISYYYHAVKKITDRIDLTNSGSIEINFDPIYARVILHSVVVRRGSQVLNRLIEDNIKVLQREARLENQLYTGQKSLHLFIEDLRLGDTIDYCYTVIKNKNCSLSGFDYLIHLPSKFSIAKFRERLICPSDLDISIRYHSIDTKPTIRTLRGAKEYVWEIKPTPVKNLEKDVPGWHDQSSWIEVRKKNSWQDIAKAQLKLYQPPAKISKNMEQYIKNISSKYDKKSEQFLAVLRFIQDKFRYLGLANHNRSHPTNPSLVFQRRFGDCKDQTYLLLTILRKLRIEAYPVLVETDVIKEKNSFLPSARIFSHVMLMVKLENKTYWVDPTSSYQRGTLENISQPNYGYALVVSQNTTGLTKMPEITDPTPTKEIFETFDLRAGENSKCEFKVKTIHKGYAADDMRQYFFEHSFDYAQEKFLNYYKTLYPSIKVAEELRVTDDEIKNILIVEEKYILPQSWHYEKFNGQWSFKYYAEEFKSYIERGELTQRVSPLYIAHPTNISKEIKLLLPKKEWDLDLKSTQIKNDIFEFSVKKNYKNNILRINYAYKSLKDHVDPSNIGLYNKYINEVITGGNIYYLSDPQADFVNWPIVLLIIFLTPIFIFLAFKLYYYDMRAPAITASDFDYSGLKGWLSFFFITFPLIIYSELRFLYEHVKFTFSVQYQTLTTNPLLSDVPHHLHALFAIAELAWALLMLITWSLSILLFFKRKALFPIFYVILSWSNFAFQTLSICVLNSLGDSAEKNYILLIKCFVYSIIWTPYLLKSQRVKKTFVRN